MNGKSPKELAESNLRYVGKTRLNTMTEEALSQVLKEYVRIEDSSSIPSSDATKSLPKDALVEELLKRKQDSKSKARKPSPLGTAVQADEATPTAEAPDADPPGPPPASPSFRRPKKPVEVPSVPPEPVETPPPPPEPPRPSHTLPDGEKTKLVPSGEEGVALEITVAKQGESTRVFKERHEFRVVSFNSLKLRTGKVGLEEQWLMLIATLATFDVVVVQEVPAEASIKDVEKTRAYLLKKAFEHHSGDEWSIVLSEPCGPGNLEVHVALVRKPIEIVSSCTNRTACSVPLDHAPLTFKIKDSRFKADGDKTWVITSVHFPPKSRSRDRDVQIKAFLREYESQSAFRLDTPLTEKGAKDAKTSTVHHIVCGDFNDFVGTGYELERYSFAPPLLGEHVSTSSGGQAYDNFLLSKFAANKFSIGADVLELQMAARFSKGEDGLSDHHPIALCIKDTAVTKKKKEKKASIQEDDDEGLVV